MKKAAFLIVLLAVLSVLSGYLMSRASLVGRAGISLFYKQYRFLKVWWQGALVVFIIWLALFLLQGWLQRKWTGTKNYLLHIIAFAIALAGLYITYFDFRHTLTHRLLGERFHIGAYLFWIGWMIISLFYLVQPRWAKAEIGTNTPIE